MKGPDPDRPLLLLIDAQAEGWRALEDLLVPLFRVRSYSLPDTAIDAIDEETAAVLLDVGPKYHDGKRAFDAIVAKNPHLPVIFLSPFPESRETTEPGLRHQPFAVFSRAGEPRLLLDIVDRAVRYSRAITEIKQLVVKVQGIQAARQMAKTREP